MTTLDLKYPIKTNGISTSTLTFKRPTAFDMSRAMQQQGDEVKRSVFLVSCLAGISMDDAWTLDFVDLNRCSEVIGSFLEQK